MKAIMVGAVFCALLGCAQEGATRPSAAAQKTPEPSPDRRDFAATLAAGETVSIDNPYGDVRLRFGGYANALEIHAVVQQPPGASEIAMQPVDDKTRYLFAPRLPAGALLAEGQRIDLVAFVPLGHAVVASTEQGLIESRGVRGDVHLSSVAGDIAIRGTQGRVQAVTGAGNIEASFDAAPPDSKQRLQTTTGNIVLAIDDHLDAALELATSGVFATEFSLDVERLPGQEPNKRARAVVGADEARVDIESRRGEIRLLRRSPFTSPGGKPVEQEQEDNDSD